jgi:hypothetical protein
MGREIESGLGIHMYLHRALVFEKKKVAFYSKESRRHIFETTLSKFHAGD